MANSNDACFSREDEFRCMENEMKTISNLIGIHFDQIKFLLSLNRSIYLEMKSCTSFPQILEVFKRKELFNSKNFGIFAELFKELEFNSFYNKYFQKYEKSPWTRMTLNKNHILINRVQQKLSSQDNPKIIYYLNNYQKSASASTLCDFYLESKYVNEDSELKRGSIFYSKLLNSLKLNQKMSLYQEYAPYKYDDEIDQKFKELFPPHDEVLRVGTVKSTCEIYNYNQNTTRGFCIVLNINEVKNEKPRKGSEKDVINIKNTFECLNYDVKICKEKVRSNILEYLKNISACSDLESHDSFIMFLMSHGLINCILDYDREQIFYEEIFEIFRANNCENLIGKPKFFIIAACQVDETNADNKRMLGISSYDTKMEVDSKSSKLNRQSSGKLFDDEKRKYSELQDFIIYMAAINGTVSFRDTNGTILVQHLTENIKKNEP